MACSTGLDAGALRHRHLHGLTHIAAALPVATHQHRAPALRSVGFNTARARQLDAVGHQDNLAALLDEARGTEQPAVLEHRALQRGERVGRENDLAPFGPHRAAVFNQGRNGLRRGGDARQTGGIVVEVQRDSLARGQCHGAGLRHDHALVAHLGRKQRDVAAQRRLELALVDHTAGAACAAEGGLARHEFVGIGSAGGGDQATHIDLRRGRKVHPVGIAQKHLAVGTDLPVNLGGVVAQDVVEHHRAAAGLVELHLGLASDIEAGPVNDGSVAGLVDRHQRRACRCGAGVDADASAADHAALRQLLGGRRCLLRMGQADYAAQGDTGERRAHGLRQGMGGALALARCARSLGHGLQLLGAA